MTRFTLNGKMVAFPPFARPPNSAKNDRCFYQSIEKGSTPRVVSA